MWKQKIGISTNYAYKIPTCEVVEIIAKAGFDAISPAWKNDGELYKVVEHARSLGLSIQSMHAPFTISADMWGDDEEKACAAKEELFGALKACAQLQIPVLVCHTWIGFSYTQKPGQIGLDNFSTVVEKAEKLNIKIAFENTEGEEFLFTLMDYFKDNKTVGFCWDSGHEMCYNGSADLLAKYGDRLMMTHLNDNLGVSRFDGSIFWTDDLHLLPYDGIADWKYNVERLKKSAPLEFLNFELNISSKPGRHENDVYADMKLEVYFAEAYKRACRIAHEYSKE